MKNDKGAKPHRHPSSSNSRIIIYLLSPASEHQHSSTKRDVATSVSAPSVTSWIKHAHEAPHKHALKLSFPFPSSPSCSSFPFPFLTWVCVPVGCTRTVSTQSLGPWRAAGELRTRPKHTLLSQCSLSSCKYIPVSICDEMENVKRSQDPGRTHCKRLHKDPHCGHKLTECRALSHKPNPSATTHRRHTITN